MLNSVNSLNRYAVFVCHIEREAASTINQKQSTLVFEKRKTESNIFINQNDDDRNYRCSIKYMQASLRIK